MSANRRSSISTRKRPNRYLVGLQVTLIFLMVFICVGVYLHFKKSAHQDDTIAVYNLEDIGSEDEESSMNTKPIAIVFPQFHSLPENDKFWGSGFTEWTFLRPMGRVVNDMILRKPHADLGYYDLSEHGHRTYMRQLADHFGVYGFCFYHYWFYDHAVMDKAVQRMIGKENFEYTEYLKKKNHSSISLMRKSMQSMVSEPNKPFFFCWANEGWTRRWDGSENEVILGQKYDGVEQSVAHFRYMLDFFKHKNYIKIDGRPVFAMYRIERKDLNHINRIFDIWQSLAREHGFSNGILFLRFLGPFDNSIKSEHIKGFVEFEPGLSWVHKGGGPSIFEGGVFNDKAYRLNNLDVPRRLPAIAHYNRQDEVQKKFRTSQFKVYDLQRTWERIESQSFEGGLEVASTSLGTFFSWNNAPRRNFTNGMYWNYPHMCDTVDSGGFEQHLHRMKDKVLERVMLYPPTSVQSSLSKFFFLTAWNEWNEQSLFEPNDVDGYDALMAVKRVFKAPAVATPSMMFAVKNTMDSDGGLSVVNKENLPVWSSGEQLTVIHIGHKIGGTEKHIVDLMRLFHEYRHVFIGSEELTAVMRQEKNVILLHFHSAMVGEGALKWDILDVIQQYCGDVRFKQIRCFLTVHDFQWLFPHNPNPSLIYLATTELATVESQNAKRFLAYMDHVIYPCRFVREYFLKMLYPTQLYKAPQMSPQQIIMETAKELQDDVTARWEKVEIASVTPWLKGRKKKQEMRRSATSHEVVPHCDILQSHTFLQIPARFQIGEMTVINIAHVGVFNPIKGSENFMWLIENVRSVTVPSLGKVSVMYHIFGPLISARNSKEQRVLRSNRVQCHGYYREDELERKLLDKSIHIIAMLGGSPETWSYAFSAVLRTGLPLVYLNTGAYLDRIPRFLHAPMVDQKPSRDMLLKLAGAHKEDFENFYHERQLRRYFPVNMDETGRDFDRANLIRVISDAALTIIQQDGKKEGFRPQSVNVQPHKWYLMNYDEGPFLKNRIRSLEMAKYLTVQRSETKVDTAESTPSPSIWKQYYDGILKFGLNTVRSAILAGTEPTSQPSSSPSSQPSAQPSTQPSAQPSGFPSSQPTSQPSAEPSTQPSAQPSTQPSSQPSLEPSTQPSARPSSQPSMQPSGQPTVQPTLQPSASPSTQPTAQPSSIPSFSPSAQPISHPSSIPTKQPSSSPTSMPTSMPSINLLCPGGYFLTRQPHHQFCSPCPAGYAAAPGENKCSLCPPGYYVTPTNSSEFIPCPLNFYQPNYGSTNCIACPAGYITGAVGSINKALCVNPSGSIINGFIVTFILFLVIWPYLYEGRLQRIAFTRRERLIKRAVIIAGAVSRLSDLVSRINASSQNLIKEKVSKPLFTKSQWLTIRKVLFVLIAMFMIFVVVLIGIVMGLFELLFNAMVLYRSFHLYIKTPFKNEISLILNVLANMFHLDALRLLAYPFVELIDILSSIHLNLSAVQISCAGAQAPALLLINLLIVGVVVIIIRSDAQVYWDVAQQKVLSKAVGLIFNSMYTTKRIRRIAYDILSVLVVMIIPPPRKIIQYSLSFVTLMDFFANDGVGLSNNNCDNAFNFPLDSFLAILTTCLVYIVLCPIVYMLAQVMIPCFQLGFPPTKFEWIIAPFKWIRLMTYSKKTLEEMRKISQSGDVQFQENHIKGKIVEEKTLNATQRYNQRSISSISGNYETKNALKDEIETGVSQDSVQLEVTASSPMVRYISKKIAAVTRFVASWISLDWLYVRVVMSVVISLYKSYTSFLIGLEDAMKTDEIDFENQDNGESEDKSVAINRAEFQHQLDNIRTEIKGMVLPPVPWFLGYFDHFATEEGSVIERRIEVREWKEERKRFPSFAIASRNVRRELQKMLETSFESNKTTNIFYSAWRRVIHSLLLLLVRPASYIIVFQLWTHIGRMFWLRVIENYAMLFIVAFGCWPEFAVPAFNLIDNFRHFVLQFTTFDNAYGMSLLGSQVGEPVNGRANSNATADAAADATEDATEDATAARLRQSFDRNERVDNVALESSSSPVSESTIDERQNSALLRVINDPKFLFQQYVSAIVSVRVVLLQLFPTLAVFSIVAVDLSPCPILVFSPTMLQHLPPLIADKPFTRARQLLVEEYEAEHKKAPSHVPMWKVFCLGLFMVNRESRLLHFFFLLIKTLVMLVVVFGGENEYMKTILLNTVVVALTVAALMNAMYFILLLHKLMFTADDRHESDTLAKKQEKETKD